MPDTPRHRHGSRRPIQGCSRPDLQLYSKARSRALHELEHRRRLPDREPPKPDVQTMSRIPESRGMPTAWPVECPSIARSAPAGHPSLNTPWEPPEHDRQRCACGAGFRVQPSCRSHLPDGDRDPLRLPFGEGERKQFGCTQPGRKGDDPPAEADRRAIAGRCEAHPAIGGQGPRASGPRRAGLHHLIPRQRLQRRGRCGHRGAGRHGEDQRRCPSSMASTVGTQPARPAYGRTRRRSGSRGSTSERSSMEPHRWLPDHEVSHAIGTFNLRRACAALQYDGLLLAPPAAAVALASSARQALNES